MRILLLAIFLICSHTSDQILNAESLRKVTDTSGFSGALSASFALKRNTNDFLTLGSDIHLQYKMRDHLILFKNDVAFQKIEDQNFDNSLITHLRYNYRFHDRIAWEIFIQGQYNKINLIDFRGLAGTGPRFKLSSWENYKFYLGTLVMYEHEKLTDGITPTQKHFRGSTYLSFSIYQGENLTIISTTYFQPRLDKFSDYRITTDSSLLVNIFKNFALKTTYRFTYDSFPAVGIPNSQYDFTTGISYSFD